MMEYSKFLDEDIKFDKIERLDCEGGTCEAYIVHIDGKAYFMKRLRSQYNTDPNYRLIFNKEFEIGKAISNCYIPQYMSLGEDGKGLYILMEYVAGSTLQEKFKRDPAFFDNDRNIEKILMQLLEGLKVLHDNNIVHLDITSRNVILCQVNNNVKILDLGFCMESSYSKTAGYTPGENVAPELKNKQLDQIDASTDFYALGALLVEIEKVRKRPLPLYLQRIKNRCLQQQKDKRYDNAGVIIGEIKRHKMIVFSYFVAVVAVVALAVFGFTFTSVYKNICDYIAWERGLIPEKFEEGGVFYRITVPEARIAEVTYQGNDYNEFSCEYKGFVTLPANVTHRGRTFKVNTIANDALSINDTKRVVIEEGIESIGDYALSRGYMDSIIYIPKSVESIGKGILMYCAYIDGITVDAGNPRYDSREGCNAIIETATNTLIAGCCNSKIPQGITKLGEHSFRGQIRLGSINIPESVTVIGDYAFHFCAFYSITLPQQLTHIGNYAFQWCENLLEVEIPENVVYIGEAALSNCPYRTLVIPDKVTYIGNYAFDQCHNLTTATIGKSVSSIGAFAFDGCDNLTRIFSRIPGDKLFAVEENTFGSFAGNCTLYVPRGAKAVYQKTMGWNRFAKIVETDL